MFERFNAGDLCDLRVGACPDPEEDPGSDWSSDDLELEQERISFACLCKFHHRLKDEGDWSCSQDLLGRLTWTSPHGQSYRTEPTPRFGDPPPDFQPPKPPTEASERAQATLRQICGLDSIPGPRPDGPVPF